MENIWNTIPLEDYEFHMQHQTVGQLNLLNELTKKYLKKFRPETVMILGVAGGNGLEHVDSTVTNSVFGIDINQNYLNQTQKRFKDSILNLNLVNLDISTQTKEKIAQVSLIWAALIFEYIETDKCFDFIDNNIQENGYLIITVQENNGVNAISQTGIETIKSVGKIFKPISESDLVTSADKFGFCKIDFEENLLPNKKSLKTYTFWKRNNEPPT